MSTVLSRRAFLSRTGAVAGGLALSGPLIALSERMAAGASLETSAYGPLINKGDLWLPEKFKYAVVSREGRPMSNGEPTPSRFDGMTAFGGPGRTTILLRNHENRSRIGFTVPTETSLNHSVRYDQDPAYNGGVTRLVVDKKKLVESRPVLGGTTHNCAGGATPWGTWITCEEIFWPESATQFPGATRHGYVFEVGALEDNPTAATPITRAGRFDHEAVAWVDGALYQTEDVGGASFYRYVPDQLITKAGDLAASTGKLQALVIEGHPVLDTRLAESWPGGIGAELPVTWVDVPIPDPNRNVAPVSVRAQAQSLGAALFARTEGCWGEGGNRVYFDCTTGGSTALPPRGFGQIFELNTARSTLTLLFESPEQEDTPGPEVLIRPDNLVVSPVGDLLMCEDTAGALEPSPDPPNHIRGLTKDGELYAFARSETNPTEFCGACFDPNGKILYVNQQGRPNFGDKGVTYAIWGPW